jgi:sortase A
VANSSRDGRPTRRRSRADYVVRFIGILGRVFVGAGVLLLFFTAYLLWGTGVYTKGQQKHFEQTLATNPTVGDDALENQKVPPPARPDKEPVLGSPLFHIKVPKIGLDAIVVNGVEEEQLKKGPGLFPTCREGGSRDCVSAAKYPGERGNVAISGHRTTYGAPFFRVNELSKGDTIDFTSGRARYRYKVREQKIVDPIAGFEVVEQHGRTELTLTTCHPRFSAAQRLIIHADFVGSSIASAPTPGRSGQPGTSAAPPVIPADVLILASIAAACALGSLGLSKRYRTAAAYVALGIVGAAGLWVGAFPRVLALMPSNF